MLRTNIKRWVMEMLGNTTNKPRFSDSIIAQAQTNLRANQEKAIDNMVNQGKYNKTLRIAAVKAVRSSS